MIYQYVCKFYLNASHFIYINDNPGATHSHCFEFVVDIGTKSESSFVSFTEIEKSIENLLAPYQEQLLNDVKPFDEINPTLENIAIYFKQIFLEELKRKEWVLLTLELSETPTRSYIISVAEEITKSIENKEEKVLFDREIFDNINKEEQVNEGAKSRIMNNGIRRKVVQGITPKSELVINMWDTKTNTSYPVKKILNAKPNEYDYEIPEELMHYDYEDVRDFRRYKRFHFD